MTTKPGTPPVIGVIGGSGIYEIDGLENAEWQRVESPFGEMSDEVLCGELDSQPMAFLPRHGRGHRIPPSEINFRANIDGLKRLGVTEVLSVSACGSLKEELPPGTFVVCDQFIDRTFARVKSFFGTGLVAHVGLGHPTCSRLAAAVGETLVGLDIPHQMGGTYLAMEGPQFSTRAESELYRSWGGSVIGMTALPEAKLAREAEICYATLACSTDYDCWHPDHDDVTVDLILKNLNQNVSRAKEIIGRAAARLNDHPSCQFKDALRDAIVTPPELIPEKLRRELAPLISKYAGVS